jgi:hypothetical protein
VENSNDKMASGYIQTDGKSQLLTYLNNVKSGTCMKKCVTVSMWCECFSRCGKTSFLVFDGERAHQHWWLFCPNFEDSSNNIVIHLRLVYKQLLTEQCDLVIRPLHFKPCDIRVFHKLTQIPIKKLNSVTWVRKRTILTKWPPLSGEVIAKFCG